MTTQPTEKTAGELIAELEQHNQSMTPGEWRSCWPDVYVKGQEFPPEQAAIVTDDTTRLEKHRGLVVGTVYYDGENTVCNEQDSAGVAAIRNALPAIIAALRRAEKMRKGLRVSADGDTLMLGMDVWVVRVRAQVGSEYGYGGGPLDSTSAIIECRVVSTGILGANRVGCLEDGSSRSFSAACLGVFASEDNARAALRESEASDAK